MSGAGRSQCVCVLLASCYAPPAQAVVPYNAVAACRHPSPHHGLRHCQLRGPLRLLPRALGQSWGRGAEAERDGRRWFSERIFRDKQWQDKYGRRRRRGWRLSAASQARGWRGLGWRWWRWRAAAVQPQHRDTSGPLSVAVTGLRMYAPILPSTPILTIRHRCCW